MALWTYLENGGKRAIEIAHRRWGKDDVALHFAATEAMQKVATYWHMLPEASQARKAIWNAINPHTGIRRIDEAFPVAIRTSTNDQEMFIRFINGSTWQVVGSDNYKSLVGAPPYGIVFSEWAKAKAAAWAFLSPILEENGGWAVFITTPEGDNHAAKLLKRGQKDSTWFAQVQTVADTGFPLARVESARLDYHALYGKEAGDALIEQEYYCSFTAPVLGAVYGKAMTALEKEGRFISNIYDETLPVYTAWDLGYDDSTAIWFFQMAPNECRLIDYFEDNGQDIGYYCAQLYEKKYTYGRHFVPHDAANKLLAAGGRSIVQQAYELGVEMTVIPATSQQNGIEAARKVLEITYIDPDMCELGVNCLKNYRFQWDEDKKTFRSTPVHDHSSHGCDAFEIIGQVWKNPLLSEDKPKPKYLHDLTAKDVFWPDSQPKDIERI